MEALTFVVSIERNRARCNETIELLKQVGINAQPWWGVDGKQPIQFREGESVDRTSRTYHAKRGRPIPPTTVGCFLSHYRLMKHALEQGWERIAVFEDDAKPLPALKQALSALLASDNSFEYVNLRPAHITSSIFNAWDKLWHPLSEDHYLVRNVTRTLGMLGYVVNLSCLQRVVPRMMPISDDVDVTVEAIIIAGKIPSFSIWPSVLAHEGENAIDRGPYGQHHRLRRLITRWLFRKRLAAYKRQRHMREEALLADLRAKHGELAGDLPAKRGR